MKFLDRLSSRFGWSARIACALSALILPGAGSQAWASNTIIVQWNEVTLEGIRQTHPGPPIVARMLAMVDAAMYDAWTAYSRDAIPLYESGVRRQLTSATDANKVKAISYAAYRVEVDLFPAFTTAADNLMASLGFDPNDASTDATTPAGIGNRAAAAVLEARHHDGSNQLGDLHPGPYTDYTGYKPVNTPDRINDPNRWQPLRVSDGKGGFVVQTYVAPFWGKVTPFAKLPEYRGDGPDLLPGDEAKEGARKILKYSAELTDEQKVIAEYWKDGPRSELPPGHWSLFAEFVSRRDHHTIDQDARMFFAQSNAILDAGIMSWAVKRRFDSSRPVTLVHYLFTGKKVLAWAGPFQGTKIIDGETWAPYQPSTIVTPPFPEYFSGHSIFSAAGAEVLKRFTGSDNLQDSVTFAVGSSSVEPGLTPRYPVTLFWKTFSDAADQAGISRRYGGIHFIPGDLDARKMGREIGRRAWAKAICLFFGERREVADGDGCETWKVASP